MWPRYIEVMLGLWLLVSPFVFRYEGEWVGLWANDFLCGALIVAIALSTHWTPLRRLHVLELVIALWLIGFGWANGRGSELGLYHNYIVTGLLVAMHAIIPTASSSPPPAWQRFYEDRERKTLEGARP